MNTSLPVIAALVRAGAVGRAWELFEAGGHANWAEDPAAVAVKGRLLKALARQTGGADRTAWLNDSAEAYQAANQLSPAPYLAINAASLFFQAGQTDRAAQLAQAVLTLLDQPEPPADTPYFLAATRAEALLVLGDVKAARAALAHAATCDPDGWDDRAATIAQLREIIAVQGGPSAWLAQFAPPDSLHFAGHLGISAGGSSEAELITQLDRFLDERRIGFAWGALAAGCDIVIAEALLARGVALHAVLPCPPENFAEQSVRPAGAQWHARYLAVLDRCASTRNAGQSAVRVHDPLATAYAGELAIGGALLNARRYGTAVHQLIVLDQAGGGANTARQAALWRPELGPQHRFVIERDATVEAIFPPEAPDPARQLALHVAIRLDCLSSEQELPSSEINQQAEPISAALSDLPTGIVRAQPGIWEFACSDPLRGIAAIQAVLASCAAKGSASPSIGAHLGITPLIYDPASNTNVAYGAAPTLARGLMQFAPGGIALISDALAVTMAARGTAARTELYLPDEPTLQGAAHVLQAVDQ